MAAIDLSDILSATDLLRICPACANYGQQPGLFAVNSRYCRRHSNERARSHHRSVEGKTSWLISSTRARAKRLKRSFTLTREWLKERLEYGYCEVTGLPFDYSDPGADRVNPFAPSLDRFDLEFGYTPENTRVVCTIFNFARGAWSDDAVMIMAAALLQRNLK